MEETTTYINGVNVIQLVDTIEAIKSDPDIAKFQFRATTRWIIGGHCRTEFNGFYGAKQEDTSRHKPIVLEGDEPPVLLGNNWSASAVETVLHALASCLSVGFVYNAVQRNAGPSLS